MDIAILLATFNSEKYLKPQIDSILNQDFQDFKLYIRDDGSTDSTLDIINTYLNQFSNIVMLDDPVTQRGPMVSFMWMLENVVSDYYMFCDHDDVWLSSKINLTYEKMRVVESLYPQKPVVVHSDLKVVNADLEKISPSFWKLSKINPEVLRSFNYLAVHNGLTGCTMMINKSARSVSIPIISAATMHDAWISLRVANSGGIVDYVNQITMLYRQHENNVIGVKKISTVRYLRNKILNFGQVLKLNKERLLMVQSIRPFGIFKYLFYKFSYFLKR